MLYVPSSNDFRYYVDSHASTRPTASYGTQVISNSTINTMGSWTTILGTPTEYDCYGIMVHITNAAVSAAFRPILFDIGIDPAGGTSYTTKIPYLIGSAASGGNILSGGIWYYFPLFIPAGSTVGARSQSSTSTHSGFVRVMLYGQPVHPESTRYGTSVEAININPATSLTTNKILIGTTTKSAWSSIGSPTSPAWWLQVGYDTNNDTTLSNAVVNIDVAAGNTSFKRLVITDTPIISNTAEAISNMPLTAGCTANIDSSVTLYARGWSSAASDGGPGVAVYALS